MSRGLLWRALPLIALPALGALWPAAAAGAVSPTMHGFVHEDNSIGLTFDDGTPVGSQARTPPTIPPGTYTVSVVDDAMEHDFHLSGPGVDVATTTGGTGSATWTVTFQPGSQYRFQCDTHFDFMFGVFQTSGTASSGSGGSSSGGSSSSGASSSTSSGGSASTALRGTLAASVSAAGTLTLDLGGRPVSRLAAGRYRITVVDRARTQGFVLRRAGHAAVAISGGAFVGTRSTTLVLSAGHWTFSGAAGGATRSFTVAA